MLLPGGFKWHDGTPLGYVNWADGEPTGTNWGESEQCVEMWSNGYWNDIDCLFDQYYVCKKEKSKYHFVKVVECVY